MKKKVILLASMLIILIGGVFAQTNYETMSATYTVEDISTDNEFDQMGEVSTCPGTLNVAVPNNAIIVSVDVEYSMTAIVNSRLNDARSQLICTSPNGTAEPAVYNGTGGWGQGTELYNRTGLDIANGVTPFFGFGVDFELHAGNSFWNAPVGCDNSQLVVDNNTWIITVTYLPAGSPGFASNPNPADMAQLVGLDTDLTWDFGDNTTTYDVYFDTDNPPTTKVVDNATPGGASGIYDPGTMMDATEYFWRVVCKNATNENPGHVWSFTTKCGALAYPYFENFDGVTSPDFPPCWIPLSNSTNEWTRVNNYFDQWGSAAKSTPNVIQFNADAEPSPNLVLVLPEVGTVSDLMLTLYGRNDVDWLTGNPYTYPIEVGTITDPSDITTFTPYTSFVPGESWTILEVYFADYIGTDTYIAIKGVVPQFGVVWLDDVTVDLLPTCIKPTDLIAIDVQAQQATIGWTDMNGATLWNIEYVISGTTPTGVPTVTGVTNPYTITDLLDGTYYDIYVQADCGSDDESYWSWPITILTNCLPWEVPFFEDFGVFPPWPEVYSPPLCWSTIEINGSQFGGMGFQDYNAHTGMGVWMAPEGDVASELILIAPELSPDVNTLRTSFWARSGGDRAIIIGTITDPADETTFTPYDTISGLIDEHQLFTVYFSNYTGTDTYIAWRDNAEEYPFQQVFIDDITVEEIPSCVEPYTPYVDGATSSSAILNWIDPLASATDYEIEAGAPGFTPGTGTASNSYTYYNPAPTGTDSFEMTGLSASTTYDTYIRTDCSGGDYSIWVGPVPFLTGFGPFASLPVTEDFETGFGITGNSPFNTQNWVINTDLQVSGLNSVHNPYDANGDNVLFMLGTFDFTSKADVMLSFWHIAKTDGNYDHCYIEISTDGGNTYDQLPESTYTGTGWYREEGVYNNPEGPCFDEDSYADWGTSNTTPENTWWKKEYFNLTDYNMYDNVVIRFRLVSDGYTNRAGWYIDNIAVETLGAPAFNVDPLSIEEDASETIPVVNTDMTMGNTGDFPTSFTASVVYDEMELLSENFDAGIPVDWTIINNGNNNVTWTDTTSSYNNYDFDGTPFAICDGYQNYGPAENTMDDELISPAIDASAYIGETLLLEFDQAFDADYNPGDTARVYVYDGTDWIMIYESWEDDGYINWSGNGIHKVYDVVAYANANFQVKFHYIEGSITSRGQYFAIDNVCLRASMFPLGWLTIDGEEFTSGVVMPDADMLPSIVDVQMDATGYDLGAYTAEIEVTSADPGNPSVTVPVTMNVVAPQVVQEYTLGIGYQFISTRIIPEDMDMQLICNDILDNLDFVRNTGGYMLRKIGPNWINGIGDWATTEGYLFKMLGEDEFSISGEVINAQTPIDLLTGYQFISFLPENQTDALVAFNDILDNLDFVRNTAGLTVIKIGPNWINGIGDLMPGEGYLVKMNASDVLIYPVDGKKFTGITNIKSEYFNFEGGNAADPVYTMYVSGLNIGDEVAAYDGNLMVGATTVISENVFDNSLAIFNTLTYGQGYSEGNPIVFKVWNKTTNDVVNADFSMEAVYNSYVSNVYPGNDGEFSVVNFSKGTSVTNDELIIYPNPATDEINISSPSDIINITIYNYVGQSVYSGNANSSNVKINTNNFEAGIYIIRIQTCKGIETQKVTIQ